MLRRIMAVTRLRIGSTIVVVFLMIALIYTYSLFFDLSKVSFTRPALPRPEHYGKFGVQSGLRKNVWADLDIQETRDILDFLHNFPNNLNLTSSKFATPFDDYVLSTEVLRPNKSEALNYVDKRSETAPSRWARAVIYSGTGIQATLDEYMVGPLPPTEGTQIRPLSFYHNSGKSSSPNLVPDMTSLKDWPYSVAEEISDITQSLLGSVINAGNTSDPNGLEMGFRDPWIDEDGRTVRWCMFQRA